MVRVIGAGLPRTGTWTLKHAFERLLGEPCYHMRVLHDRLEQLPVWRAAIADEPVDWHGLLDGYAAAVDWPASAFWERLSYAFPDALIVLSVRENADTWWRSADSTVLGVARNQPSPEYADWHTMFLDLLDREFGPDWSDEEAAKAAYDRHVAHVRDTAPAGRLLEWRAEQGWAPLCEALDVPVPHEPFPHLNTKQEWGSSPDRRTDLTT